MISIAAFYPLIALLIALAAWQAGAQKQFRECLFWAVLALLMAGADHWPDAVTGAGVLLLAVLAPAAGPRIADSAGRLLHSARLFWPLLALPALTIAGVMLLPKLQWQGTGIFLATQTTLLAVAVAAVLSWLFALRITRSAPTPALRSGTPLIRTLSWALVLPLMLATLGAVFSRLGIGQSVADLLREIVALDMRLGAVLCFGLGTALLTMLMGNAFAAWPIMFAGIGLPVLVQQHGAEPASLAAIGMLTGYCGTLLTPMAANYNIVPAALLELDDRYAVIRAQVKTALPLMAANLLLMYWLPFR